MADFSSSGLTFFVFVIVFSVICGAFVALRFWAIKVSRRKFYLDDAFVTFAYANAIALGGVGLWAAVNGLGKSMTVLTKDEIVVIAKLIMASNVCWLLSSVFTKLSILWMYSRIFSTKEFRRWSYVVFGIVVCYGISFFVVYITNCEPVDQLWNPTPTGHCRDMQISDFATVAINVVLDLAILILPMPTLWGLQLPVRKKIVISAMFSLGFGTIAIMIWRITETVRTRSDADFTAHLGLIGLISFFELWFGIIVACTPTLAPLFKVYVRPAVSKLSKASAANSRYGQVSIRMTNGKAETYVKTYESSYTMHGDATSEEYLNRDMAITTECAYDPASRPSHSAGHNVIHVRNDIESRI